MTARTKEKGSGGGTPNPNQDKARLINGSMPADVFQELAGLNRWVPFIMVPRKDNPDKFDKIPNNGRHNLFTTRPEQWMTQAEALAVAKQYNLPGIGLVLTGGIVLDKRVLAAIDIDDVAPEAFTLPFRDTYSEMSPSHTGLHQLVWVPKDFADAHADAKYTGYPHCDHLEIYIGTSPRFITLPSATDPEMVYLNHPPRKLTKSELAKLATWLKLAKLMAPALPPIPDGGSLIDLGYFDLTPDQRQLIEGRGNLNRSDVLFGLLIKLIDAGTKVEDVLATLLTTPMLWKICLDHRRDDVTKATEFAREEIGRAFKESMVGKREALVSYNDGWKPKPPNTVSFPYPFPGPMAAAVNAGLEVAHKRQPELTMMAVLSAMAAICGSFCELWDGGRLNLYFLGIAPTGAGKDIPFKLAKKLGKSSKPIGPKLINAPGSGEGLEDTLIGNVATYCVVDEIAHFFCVMNDAKAPAYMRATARKLLELFTASNDIYQTRALAGKEPRTVPNPAFNLLGFTTPEKMGKAFNPDDFVDGLAGRILFVITDENPPLREVETPLIVPKDFDQMAQRIAGRLKFLMVSGTVIGRTDDARQLLTKLNREFDKCSRNPDSQWESALAVRSVEKLKHIAGVLAMWGNPDKPEIAVAHVEWAAQFVRASNACVLRLIGEHMHGGDEQANAAKLKELLYKIHDLKYTPQRMNEVKALGEGWVAASMLLRVSKLERDDFHKAVHYLEELGDIEVEAHKPMKLRLAPDDNEDDND